MSATTADDAMHPTTTQTTSVSIAGGLKGIVVTSFDASTTSRQSLPDHGSWCELIPTIVNDPSSLPGYQVLKYSGGNEVFRGTLTWESNGRSFSIDIVCKKTISPRGLKGLADSLRTSRARKNFERGLLLIRAGIATPLPFAAIDRPSPRANWLITEFLPDLIDLDRIALAELPQISCNQQRRAKDSIITATSDLFARLDRNGLFHRDLKASNILIAGWQRSNTTLRSDAAPHTVLVDLDGLQQTTRSTSKQWKSLVRLTASLLHYPSVTRGDFARFLRSYLTTASADDSAWQEDFRRLADEAIRYEKKSRARKSHKLDGYT